MPVYRIHYSKAGTMTVQAKDMETAEGIVEEFFGVGEGGIIEGDGPPEEFHMDDVGEEGGDELDADLRETEHPNAARATGQGE